MNRVQNLSLNNTEFVAKKIHLESLPIVVNIATTSRCNINPPCVMCLRNKEESNKAEDISWKTLFRSGYLVDTASTVLLHGVGEPLVYKQLFDVASMADKGAITMFTTNGLLLHSHLKEVCESIAKLSISIDASSEDKYERIRHNSLSGLKKTIADLVSMKQRLGQKTPMIDISMCLMNGNVSDAPGFVEMGHELGVDTVHFYHLNQGPEYDWRVDWFNYANEHCHLQPDRHDKYISKALKRAAKLNMPVIFDGKPLFNGKNDFKFADNPSAPPVPETNLICEYPWRNIQINSDGTVMNCCYQTWAIGNLQEKSFAEIWNGEVEKGVRQGIVSGNFHEYCQKANCPPKGRI